MSFIILIIPVVDLPVVVFTVVDSGVVVATVVEAASVVVSQHVVVDGASVVVTRTVVISVVLGASEIALLCILKNKMSSTKCVTTLRSITSPPRIDKLGQSYAISLMLAI